MAKVNPAVCLSWLWKSLILCYWGESMWAGLIRINQGEGMKRRDQQMVAGRLQSFNLKDLGLGIQSLIIASIICKFYALRSVS